MKTLTAILFPLVLSTSFAGEGKVIKDKIFNCSAGTFFGEEHIFELTVHRKEGSSAPELKINYPSHPQLIKSSGKKGSRLASVEIKLVRQGIFFTLDAGGPSLRPLNIKAMRPLEKGGILASSQVSPLAPNFGLALYDESAFIDCSEARP